MWTCRLGPEHPASNADGDLRQAVQHVRRRLLDPSDLELARAGVRDGLVRGLPDVPEGEPRGRTQIDQEGAELAGSACEVGALASGSRAAISHAPRYRPVA